MGVCGKDNGLNVYMNMALGDCTGGCTCAKEMREVGLLGWDIYQVED
jgi:hypothetical protein